LPVETEQFLHQRKRHAWLEQLVFVIDLKVAVGVQPVALEQRVAVTEVEQRARRYRHDQPIVADRPRVVSAGGVSVRLGYRIWQRHVVQIRGTR
jgi:hypothetical protein